jgi:hypothetical protein
MKAIRRKLTILLIHFLVKLTASKLKVVVAVLLPAVAIR